MFPARPFRSARPIARALALIFCAALPIFANAPSARAEVVPPSTEIPQTLTLAEALQMFRARGLDLLIAEASVRNAEGDIQIANAVPNPGINASYGRVIGNYNASCPGCSADQWGVGVTDNAAIEDSLSGKRALRDRVARNALAAARLARVDAQRTIESQVKEAYLQVAQARAQWDFANHVVRITDRLLSYMTANVPGKFNEGDLARIRTQKLEADQAVDNALLALQQARIALGFLLGARGRVPDFDVQQDILHYAVPTSLASASDESLVRAAVDHRPDLRALGYQRARAEAAIALARRQRFPDIAFSVNYTQTGTGSQAIQPPTVTFGISAPLPLFYQQQGEIRKAEADYDAQALQHAKTAAQVVSDVTNAFASYTASKRLVERMEAGGLLESARLAREKTETIFLTGKIPVTDMLDATRTYIATQSEYLQDLTNYWTAVYELEQAVGMELRQ